MSSNEFTYTVQQILLATSDSDYLDQLVTNIKDACATGREATLMDELDKFALDKEAEIERMCNTNHQDFVQSVNQLLNARKGTVDLTTEILKLNKSIQISTEKLVENKKALVDSRGVRQNIDETTRALRMCLEVLGLANRVHELLVNKKHYAALRTLDELQNVHLKEVMQYEIADMIRKSVPAMQRMVKDAVMTDLNSWLFHIREKSQVLGSIALDQTEMRKNRQRERAKDTPYLDNYKVNSAIEIVLDEKEEYDPLEEAEITFKPLYECLHIHDALGQRDEFRVEYAQVRRQQKDLLLPSNITIQEDDISSLARLCENIAGFAILERATIQKTQNFRSQTDVDELWDSMVKKVVMLTKDGVRNVSSTGTLLRVKKFLELFIQTMQSKGYDVSSLNTYLFELFTRYSDMLKVEFSKSAIELIEEDDYMPMKVEDEEQYVHIASVSWYEPPEDPRKINYPACFPFSQMYTVCCIEIRNYLNKFLVNLEDHLEQRAELEEMLRESLDELLIDRIVRPLDGKLQSQFLGQIVQILINLEYFEHMCKSIEIMLTAQRKVALPNPVKLKARESFSEKRKTAEKRIFELVNQKIDDLVSTAEYDWLALEVQKDPSGYLTEVTRYLSHIVNSNLVALPQDIKGLVYFDALTHLASAVLSLPLQDDVRAISPAAVKTLDLDVRNLEEYVQSLNVPTLPSIFDELRQTIDLLQSNDPDEFYNIETRMKRYAAVNAMNGPILLEKLVDERTAALAAQGQKQAHNTGSAATSMASTLALFR